jgi:hypothetical protein
VVYRQGFIDGADGRGPFRDAWAYRRGWDSGQMFRKRVSSTSQAFGSHFPGWPDLGHVYKKAGQAGWWRPFKLVAKY